MISDKALPVMEASPWGNTETVTVSHGGKTMRYMLHSLGDRSQWRLEADYHIRQRLEPG
jgi:hypothetical protein